MNTLHKMSRSHRRSQSTPSVQPPKEILELLDTQISKLQKSEKANKKKKNVKSGVNPRQMSK